MTDAIISMYLKRQLELIADNLPDAHSPEYTIESYAHLQVTTANSIITPNKWAYGVMQLTSGAMEGACFVVNMASLDSLMLHLPIDPGFGVLPGDKFILRPGPLRDVAIYLTDPATIGPDYDAGKRCFIVIDRLGGEVSTRSLDNSAKSLSYQDVNFSFDMAVDCLKVAIKGPTSSLDAGYNSTISSIAAGQVIAALSHIIYGYGRDAVTPYLVSSEGFSYNYALKEREGLKAVLECVDISFDLLTK